MSESSKKETTSVQNQQLNKLRGIENTVAIRLTAFDHPGSSKSPQFNKKPISKPGPSKVKSTQNKATQMRQNLSTQRLQENEDIDDDDVRNGIIVTIIYTFRCFFTNLVTF